MNLPGQKVNKHGRPEAPRCSFLLGRIIGGEEEEAEARGRRGKRREIRGHTGGRKTY